MRLVVHTFKACMFWNLFGSGENVGEGNMLRLRIKSGEVGNVQC